MDHGWDGVYTSQERLTRLVAQIQLDRDYYIEYTGTPPKTQRAYIETDGTGTGSAIRFKYPESGGYEVYVKAVGASDYTLKAETTFSTNLGKPDYLTKTDGCGENRWVGIDNYLEVYITPGCYIEIRPLDAVITNVRLTWTLAEFYAAGGTSNFADSVAAALGIDASRVKTMVVWEGSTQVQYYITADPTLSSSSEIQANMQAIRDEITLLIQSGAYNLGSPILGAHHGSTYTS